VQCKAGDDVGGSGIRGQHWNVQGACVHGLYAFTIQETGDNGCGRGLDVAGGSFGCEKVTPHAGIKDGPVADGVDVRIDCFEKDGRCKCIVVGWGQMQGSKNNIIVYFSTIYVCP
jgi:hypothetical protein